MEDNKKLYNINLRIKLSKRIIRLCWFGLIIGTLVTPLLIYNVISGNPNVSADDKTLSFILLIFQIFYVNKCINDRVRFKKELKTAKQELELHNLSAE